MPKSIYLETPKGKKLVFPNESEEITLGRSLENYFVLEDPKVSRTHCTFKRYDLQETVEMSEAQGIKGWLSVTDLGSMNGIFLNGEKIPPQTEVPLYQGDVVTIASYKLTVNISETEETKELPNSDKNITPK